MKKIIALTTLFAAAGTFAATNTSSTKVDFSQKKWTEKVGGYYYGALYTDKVAEEEGDTPDNAFLNYFNVSYALSEKTKISTTFRFELIDANDGNGKGDRFDELDQRIGVSTTLAKLSDKHTLKGSFTVELPTSRGSQDNDKIARIKPAVSLNSKLDDYNSLMTWIGYNKDYYPKASSSVETTSRHYFSPWIVYTNTYLSEKYAFKAEYSASVKHIGGGADTAIRKKESDELNVGVDMDIAGVSVNPHLIHDVSELKAANQLGFGVQIFKGF